jgi:low temperature requirement protein LtrA
VRLLLVALMLVSLAMSASLPRAFEDLGLWIGGAYAVQQIGRTVFMVIALRGHPLEANFQRVLSWPRLAGIAALGLLALAGRAIPALALGACVAGVVVAVAITDRWRPRRTGTGAAGRCGPGGPAAAPG